MADTKEETPPSAMCTEVATGARAKCTMLEECLCFDGHKGLHHDKYGRFTREQP